MTSFSNFKSQLVSASTSAAGIELGGGGTTAYSTAADLPTSNIDTGAMAFVSESNKLYMWNGNAWFNIAIANQAPTVITGNEASYALASDGTPTIVTLVSTDPEGFPLTWSSSTSGDTQVGTVTNTDNVFTITPSTDEADAGELSITFSVTDGNNAENSTSTFILTFTPDFTNATQQAKIQSSDIAGGDEFGTSIAIDGDTAVVTAKKESNQAGAAYVFTRSGSTWTQQQKLVASDAESFDRFGSNVAISGDTIVVGAGEEDPGGQSNAGSVYVFTRSGSTWTQQQKLVASDGQPNDNFGRDAVDIDGDTIVVGAFGEDTTASGSGAAYIFTRSGSTWTQQQKIKASDPASSDQFGRSVAISGDTLVSCAWLKRVVNSSGTFSSAGAAYIFTRSGSTWTQQAKITSEEDARSDDRFGTVVDIDGDTVVCGAYGEDTPASNAGAVYVFTRSGSTWTRQARIQSDDIEGSDIFSSEPEGKGLAIEGDNLVVGSQAEDPGGINAAGSVYVFTRSGSTWTQTVKLAASDAQAIDQLGYSVAISGDTIAAGAFLEDTGGSSAGVAYIFVAG